MRRDIGELLFELQRGESLGMPAAKPMSAVAAGAYELRVKDADGINRVFYYLKSAGRHSRFSRVFKENTNDAAERDRNCKKEIMGNVKPIKMGKAEVFVADDVFDLCNILDLTPQDAIEIEFRAKLRTKIKDVITAKKLTHEQAAKLSGTSRTKITAILNGNTAGVSSDLLLRILYSLGFRTKVSFAPVRAVA